MGLVCPQGMESQAPALADYRLWCWHLHMLTVMLIWSSKWIELEFTLTKIIQELADIQMNGLHIFLEFTITLEAYIYE